jgi:hypothetical protein
MLPFLVGLGLGGLGFLAYRAVTRAPDAADPRVPASTTPDTPGTPGARTAKAPASRYEATDARVLHGVPDEQDRLVDAQGRLIDEHGRMIDKDGQVIDTGDDDPIDTSSFVSGNEQDTKDLYEAGYRDGFADYPGYDRFNAYPDSFVFVYKQGYADGRSRASITHDAVGESDGAEEDIFYEPDNLDVLG